MKSIADLLNFLQYIYHGIKCDKTSKFVHGKSCGEKQIQVLFSINEMYVFLRKWQLYPIVTFREQRYSVS